MKQTALTILAIAYMVASAIADQVWIDARQNFYTKPGQKVDLQSVFLGLPSDILGINKLQRNIEIFAGRTRIIQIKNAEGIAVKNAWRWDRAGQVNEIIIILEPWQAAPEILMTNVYVFRDKKKIRSFLISATPGELKYCKIRDLLNPEKEKDLE